MNLIIKPDNKTQVFFNIYVHKKKKNVSSVIKMFDKHCF